MCTNTTNTTSTLETLQGVAYCPLLLFGLLLNAAALWASYTQRASWTDTHIYILNLVAADSALIFFLPLRIYDSFSCLPKNYFCTFLVNTHYINMYASIFTSTAISVHRYLVVRFPLRARAWRKRKMTAFAVCLAIWVFVLTICAIFREENYPDKLCSCFERCKNQGITLQFGFMLVFAGFLLPLLTVVFCSSQILSILLKDKNTKSGKRKSSISIVTANMVVFIFCYTPIHIRFAVLSFGTPPSDPLSEHLFLSISEWIAASNCCLDSISYYFLLKKITYRMESSDAPRASQTAE
ncbi:G-protein coupled receptor 35 [Halichoeres trimaculatus]|uniref:G-protein coupled receptor 35 n=1 Tax=Halichoeres trimaculatus TaxID=147232 RepID=UPI003D9ECC36